MVPGMASPKPPDLSDLQLRIRRFAEERDWLQFHDPKNLSMAIAVEAGELMDHFRWVANDRSRQVLDDPRSRAGIEEEAADVLILLAEFADVCGIDLLAAAGRKLEANALRYPVELSRGKATKHDRLGG
jgi:NTP pyrophosphatase (non-canonical NTP hydrolase)